MCFLNSCGISSLCPVAPKLVFYSWTSKAAVINSKQRIASFTPRHVTGTGEWQRSSAHQVFCFPDVSLHSPKGMFMGLHVRRSPTAPWIPATVGEPPKGPAWCCLHIHLNAFLLLPSQTQHLPWLQKSVALSVFVIHLESVIPHVESRDYRAGVPNLRAGDWLGTGTHSRR